MLQALAVWRRGHVLHSALQLAGKRRRRGQLNAVAPGELLHLTDELSGQRFLVDTGASYSIFPHQSSQPVCGPVLKGPGGQTIACWGEKELPVQFSGRRFTWTFLLAKVEFPILGADFLKHFNLIVDLAASQLLATDTLQRFAARPPAATAAAAQARGGLFSAVESTPPLFRGVFNEFQDVASSGSSLPPVKHKTLHHITPRGRRRRRASAAWTRQSWRPLRPNSASWRRTGLFGGLPATGQPPCIW